MGNQDTSASTGNGGNPAPREVNFPAFTWDYRVVNGSCGLGLATTRKIKKGELVFTDSYEFLFADVREGDVVRFDRFEKANRRSPKDIPAFLPLTRDVLTRTHGVPAWKPDPEGACGGIISWHLETPGMLINHSCDPNIVDDSHNESSGEAYAARDIRKGEELTYDYTFQYYDHGPFFEKCCCGSDKCRGQMMGFKALTEEQKKTALPYVSEAVKAMYEADTGKGLPVKRQQKTYPPRSVPDDSKALRLVVPGPSHAMAPILMKVEEGTGRFALYAGKDFKEGEQVYEFFTQAWPENGTRLIDIVFSRKLEEGDPEENTMVRVDALEFAKRDREGVLQFSGFDLFTRHSCDPNLVYNDKDEDEDDDWHGTYAARPIQKGELLTVDFNTLLWDRTEWDGLGDGICTCGALTCRGLVKGFHFLSEEAKEELKSLSWKRTAPPHPEGSKKEHRVIPGDALTPHVRVSWRDFVSGAPGSLATSSSEEEEES
ncbi:Histone-lysine N-methyltransferase [Seminavis robusta]|uniref:Histone-lysine N-methyltransferase n=1 Tax=Seminavis robusta TaxID=568900 RepID=A0A9N8HDB2_9STRA|nr:Histone-lysine N-methyltransferase [Seminavis robusta]|eukprot:Sro252_g099610.1 Histone-lysine N-methyltransferase (487) ;mRNA; f:31092-32631